MYMHCYNVSRAYRSLDCNFIVVDLELRKWISLFDIICIRVCIRVYVHVCVYIIMYCVRVGVCVCEGV